MEAVQAREWSNNHSDEGCYIGDDHAYVAPFIW